LGIVLAVSVNVIQVLRMVDARSIYLGLDGLRRPLFFGGLAVVVAIGLLIWRRPSWPKVVAGVTTLILLIAGGCSLLKIESFYGNLIPRLTWRWAPSPDQIFADFQATRPVSHISPAPSAEIASTGQDHPGFLGRNRDGVVSGVPLATDWESHPPVELWRHPVGMGWGGFAVVGQCAVTQEQRDDIETVVCYDLESGNELWVHGDKLRFRDEHGDGPRATPTFVDGRVYTLGAKGLLNCLDGRDGQVIWQQQLLENPKKENLLWGMAGSPLVVDGLVIVTPGGAKGRAVMAFRASDGSLEWSRGDDAAAYASPVKVPISGQHQLVSFNGAGLRGFSMSGEPLWLFPWITQGERQRVNVAQPLAVTFDGAPNDRGYFLISSGYSMGMSLVEVSHQDHEWTAREVWRSSALKSKMSNFVVRDGYIYGFDNGILTCLDLKTGEALWKRGRYGHGQLLRVDDVLLIQAESGEVVLVSADPNRHQELARTDVLHDKTWNHAALAGNKLLVRNDREAVCLELPAR
jgi:outer membrane protein assembly factor BamB